MKKMLPTHEAVPTKAQFKDIKRLAKLAPDNWALCKLFAGTSRACEAEVMVAQTLQACVSNHKEHGVAFSWRGEGIRSRGGGGLVDNATAYDMLLGREYFVEEKRGRKTIIIITQLIVNYLDKYFASDTTTKNARGQ